AARGCACGRARMAVDAAPAAGGRGRVVRLPGRAPPLRETGHRYRVTAAEQRVPHARWVVAAAALVVCAALLWISRTYTFYLDEWTFIQDSPAWSIAGFFKPHNEHPSMLLRSVYWVLLN